MDANLMSDLAAYSLYVEKSFQASDGRIIGNSSQEHAAILVEGMFKNAVNEVHVLANECANGSYGLDQTINAANAFLKKGGKLKILVEDFADKDMSSDRVLFLDSLVFDSNGRKTWKENVFVRKVLPEAVVGYEYNFIVSDGAHYRLEEDRKFSTAIAGFGREFMAKHLIIRHDRIWNDETMSQDLSVGMYDVWSGTTH